MKHYSVTNISLHRFVDELTAGLIPLAVTRRTLIINQIDRNTDIRLGTDENMLAYVLWNLLNRAVCSTENSCIHIESITEGNRVMIRVRNAGAYFYRTISHSFRQVQYAAEKIGGSISIDYTENMSTTVALILQQSAA